MVWDLLVKAKQKWDLFVPLTGFAMYIRKSVLEKVKGWDENSLAEDVELAVRLQMNGYKVLQAPIYNWQEAPESVGALVRQRVRWYRGTLDAFRKHSGAILGRTRRLLAVDTSLTLLGPISGALSIIAYGILALLAPAALTLPSAVAIISGLLAYQLLYLLLMFGRISIEFSKGRRWALVRRLPLAYYYSFVLSASALKAVLDTTLGAPKVWRKSEKTGAVAPFEPPYVR